MRIQLLSDLHFEVNPHFVPEPAPHADVLVLAGDIGSYQRGAALQGAHFGLERFANWPVPVLFVPGNHEYDAQDFDAAHERLRRSCVQLGLVWLERETVVLGACRTLGGVRFIGTTLWSDFDALATPPAGKAEGHALAHLLQQREKAFRAADFYLRKTGTTRAGSPFSPGPCARRR